jgi:hypothetical protein
MKTKKPKLVSVYQSKDGKCLFTKQFDFWESSNWNEDLPPFFDRLNAIEDDRSFIILASAVLEYQINNFLKAFIPNYDILIETNLVMKIKLIKAFNIIPGHFPDMFDNIRCIRNDFAHNLKIDSFNDLEKSEKLKKHVENMKKLWGEFQEDMYYYQKDSSLLMMFKDIWRVSIEGLRVFESNIKLFRQETENKDFINYLDKLSTELRIKREDKEQYEILKNVRGQ